LIYANVNPGVSLITQVLYAIVFCSRYLDIFVTSATKDTGHVWNFTLKIFYTLSSLYIIFLMTSVYARTREREKAWKFGTLCLLGSIAITPIWYLIFRKWVLGDSLFIKVH
jgi:ER lumen protein retaining receptor